MRQILINDDNLSLSDLDYEVTRVKGLIINSKNEILIAYNNNTYQFPGGHVGNSEDMRSALLRGIKEETGINISEINGPFMQIVTYAKNYFGTEKNVYNSIFYYRVLCDDVPNLDETNYDELERLSDFNLYYIAFDDLEDFLHEALDSGKINVGICKEMLLVLEEYKRFYGGI